MMCDTMAYAGESWMGMHTCELITFGSRDGIVASDGVNVMESSYLYNRPKRSPQCIHIIMLYEYHTSTTAVEEGTNKSTAVYIYNSSQ